jgi:hypothetical protein
LAEIRHDRRFKYLGQGIRWVPEWLIPIAYGVAARQIIDVGRISIFNDDKFVIFDGYQTLDAVVVAGRGDIVHEVEILG